MCARTCTNVSPLGSSEHGAELVELDEILGYHLEQAARYRHELGGPDAALAERAGERLAAGGRHALARGDEHAAARLLERALALTRPLWLDVHLELDLARSIWSRPREAAALAAAAAERAAAAGDAAGEAYAQVVAAGYEQAVEKLPPDRLEARARAALPLLERAGDDAALAEVWHLLGFMVANMRGHWGEQADADEQALLHARRAGLTWQPVGFALPLLYGPMPAEEALQRLDQLAPDPTPHTLTFRSWLVAMLDRVDEARLIALQAHERLLEQTGRPFGCAVLAEIAILDQDLDAAAEHLRTFCDWLEQTENYSYLSTFLPRLGRVLCALGRYNDAEPLGQRGRELGDEQDAATQALWRQVQALVQSSRGEHAEAERLAREAVAITEKTDSLWCQAQAREDLADVHHAAGRHDKTANELREALDRYQRKQIIPLARRVRKRLAAMQEEEAT